MLEVRDLVDLDVASGKMIAIIGPNGAGKSTFFNLLTGHIRPDTGVVRFDGRDITGAVPRAISWSRATRFYREKAHDLLASMRLHDKAETAAATLLHGDRKSSSSASHWPAVVPTSSPEVSAAISTGEDAAR